jgi:hypothetical protein
MTNKYLKTISSTLIVGVFLFFAFGSEKSNTDKVSNKTTDCSNSKGAYNSGYSSGSLCRAMSDYSSCESFVQKYNYETGRDILVASDCYCEGFNDGKDGNPKKYNSNTEGTNTDNNYSSSNDYVDTNIQTTDNNQEEDSSEEINTNSSNDENSNSILPKPQYKIYNLGHLTNYIDAESECRNRKMRIPNYDELLEIANSPDLMKNLKPNDKSESYWSSTDYIEGQDFINLERIQNDDSKNYKKNYNPFTDKTIMTDIKMSKNCMCIE